MKEIAAGVACLPISIANVYFVGEPGRPWTLVDTGMPGSAGKITAAAEARYGPGAKPSAIVLTHGHYDHSGSAQELSFQWAVPIFVHRLEVPYLTGKSLYPPVDPTVGGPLAFLGRVLPFKGLDLGPRVRTLPPDGMLPEMPGWEWHFTPGHSPGHVSLFRASDRTLLAGDAFATMGLDSLPAIAMRRPHLSSPPRAITCDWGAACTSLERLAGLRPSTVGCGHGSPLSGASVADDLQAFAQNFAPPAHGRYALEPAITDESGIVSLPPPAPDPLPAQLAAGLGAAALAGIVLAATRRRRG